MDTLKVYLLIIIVVQNNFANQVYKSNSNKTYQFCSVNIKLDCWKTEYFTDIITVKH